MKKRTKIRISSLAIMGMFLLLASSCTNNTVTPPTSQVPVLTTDSVQNITQTTATSGGNVTSQGSALVTTRGVCWSTTANPTTSDTHTTDSSGTGNFTSSITGLNPNTLYYVRAYATNSAGTGYGNQVSFTIVTDIDGNLYHTVTIGTQVWLVENLKVIHYRNGDPITNVTNQTAWFNLSTEAYCNSNNDITLWPTYGRLYNWYAVNDSRNIAPTGWHVPSDNEWSILTAYIGGASYGYKLIETGTAHWLPPNTYATNSTGFTGLPGGYRDSGGIFILIGMEADWWCSTEQGVTSAWARRIFNNSLGLGTLSTSKRNGYSVRCVKN
jgi:uncharacterized protein (TIGR02145 family)